MLTFIIIAVIGLIIGIAIQKQDLFKNPFKVILGITIVGVIASLTINLIRLKTLNTTISIKEQLIISPYYINTDTIFILSDTLKSVDEDGLTTFKVKTITFQDWASIPIKYKSKCKRNIKTIKQPIIVDTLNLIHIRINDDGDLESLTLETTTVIVKENRKDYHLSLYMEEYVSDRWTSMLSLPIKTTFHVLRIPNEDTLINQKVLNNYNKEKKYENFITKNRS